MAIAFATLRNTSPSPSYGEWLVSILCFPCVLPCLVPVLWRMGNDFRIKKRDETPPPLTARKRRLTMSTDRKSWGEWMMVKGSENEGVRLGQEQTLLFRLPPEVRMMVYEEVIGKGRTQRVWVNYQEGKWCSFRDWSFREEGEYPVPIGMDTIPLLQSCRRVYSEAIALLYATPTFMFADPMTFITFTASILPQRFERIKRVELRFGNVERPHLLPTSQIAEAMIQELDYHHLHTCYTSPLYNAVLPFAPTFASSGRRRLTFWDASCLVLGRMKGLRSVVVSISSNLRGSGKKVWESREREAWLLAPLQGLRKGVQVEVEVGERTGMWVVRRWWRDCTKEHGKVVWRADNGD